LACHVIHHDVDVISDAPHSLTETLALAAEEKAARSSTIRVIGGNPFIRAGDSQQNDRESRASRRVHHVIA